MHSVRLQVFSYNVGAVRLYEQLGFVKEGCVRQSLWFGGKWHDTLSYGMLEDEWRALRGRLPS